MKSNRPDDPSEPAELPEDIAADLARVGPLPGRVAGRVRFFSSVGSTNDVAARLAAVGAESGTVVLADAQSAGRGRRGRAWFSPPGAGLYFSVILRPTAGGGHAPGGLAPAPSLITVAAGVAVAEGLRASTRLPVDIKWPNDLVVGWRKLAGILAESPAGGAGGRAVILGVGINLRAAAYPADLAGLATSVEAETGQPPRRGLVLAAALAALAARYQDLEAGRFGAILAAWRALSPGVRDSVVEWEGPGGRIVRGRTRDISPEGLLVVQVGERTVDLAAGEIRWIGNEQSGADDHER